MTTRGRRWAWAALIGVALCTLGLLWWMRAVDETPTGQARRAWIPSMGAPERDTGQARVRAAENEFATILCSVGAGTNAVAVRAGKLAATGVGDRLGETAESPSGDGELVLTVPPGRWSIAWLPAGFPVGIDLGTVDLVADETFRCAITPNGVAVTGRVLDLNGAPVPGARLEGCGRAPETGEDGGFTFTAPFSALRDGDRSCRLRARWQDGLLARFSEAAVVSALTPGPHTLTVDASPVAGMGISLRDTPDGLGVGYVHPGTPAEAADIRAGDLIVAIDGKDAMAMTAIEFVPYGVGKEGSTVVLDIEREGVELRKSFRRERIARVEDTGG